MACTTEFSLCDVVDLANYLYDLRRLLLASLSVMPAAQPLKIKQEPMTVSLFRGCVQLGEPLQFLDLLMTRQLTSTLRQPPPLPYLMRSVRRTSGFVLARHPLVSGACYTKPI